MTFPFLRRLIAPARKPIQRSPLGRARSEVTYWAGNLSPDGGWYRSNTTPSNRYRPSALPSQRYPSADCANASITLGAPSFGPHAVCANCAIVRSLSNAAAHEHASARKRQITSVRTTYRGPTTEALHRPEPQKSVRRLLEGINITWGL